MLTVSGFQLPPMASIWILVRAVPVVCPIAVISRRCACMRWVQRWHVEWFSLTVPLSKGKKKSLTSYIYCDGLSTSIYGTHVLLKKTTAGLPRYEQKETTAG